MLGKSFYLETWALMRPRQYDVGSQACLAMVVISEIYFISLPDDRSANITRVPDRKNTRTNKIIQQKLCVN